VSRATPLVLAAAMATASCAVGPDYRAPEVAPQGSQMGLRRQADSLDAFFDSLARSGDTSAPVTRPLVADSADLAWLAILRDTTLVGLVSAAVQENRDVLGAQARIREFRAEVGVAKSDLYPDLRLDASVSKNQIAVGAFPPTSYSALRLTADLAWELDFWGRIRRGVQASRADLAAEEAGYRATLLSLVSDVATAYLELLELRQEEAIAERTLASRRETLGLARERLARGVISQLDVHQFESEVAVPAATLAQVRRFRAQREHELATLVGRLPFDLPAGGDLARAVQSLDVPDSIPATLLARRPDVQQAERDYAAATARVGAAQAARLPVVSITADYGTQSSDADHLFGVNNEVYQVQGGVSVPLFTGGRLANTARAAEARAEQARLRYEQTVLEAYREAGDALIGVRTARDQRVAQEVQVRALRSAVELADLRYRGGVASYLEVLEAQRSLFGAELGLSQAQLLELSSAVQIYKALGGSWTQ
jgi:outer membrane protein, multidrug efflux system